MYVNVQFLLACGPARGGRSINQVCTLNRNLGDVKKILIVDDNSLIRRTLRSLLEEQRDWVICGEAENSSDAIDEAQTLHPDLVVMDLVMPVMNGIDATRALKAVMPQVPIVRYTTFADSPMKNLALEAGVHDLIDKCENSFTLVRSIRNLLASEMPPYSANTV
jgi:NarL family two-component system response regulator LiaR